MFSDLCARMKLRYIRYNELVLQYFVLLAKNQITIKNLNVFTVRMKQTLNGKHVCAILFI